MPAEDIATRLPDPGTSERARLAALGKIALERGEIAAVVLAGGMATRFGSQVKALAPVLEGHGLSFLDLKLADLTRTGADITLMTSFATHDALAEEVAGIGIHLAPQLVSLRLAADGSLFLDDEGGPSPHAPGHGDLGDALQLSGALERYRAAGVRSVFVCNVDNVGATLDPAMAGLHLELGGEITAELVSKRPGDAGGVPVRRADGSLALAEVFRVPDDFPHERFPLFNTNTLWIDTDGARGAGRLHLVRGPQGRGRARGDPVRAPRGRAHLVASVALRPRPARGSRVALRAGQGRRRSRCGAGSDRRHLPRATRTHRLSSAHAARFSAVSGPYGNGTDRVSESFPADS